MKRKWVLVILIFLAHACIATPPTTELTSTEGILPIEASTLEVGEASPVPTPLTVLPTSTELLLPTKIPIPEKGEAPSLPTPTVTITPYVLDFIQYQPLEILPVLPLGTSISGRLVVAADPDYILDFADQSKRLFQDVYLCLSTSPNGQQLAYCKFTDNHPEGQLIVEDVRGNILAKLPIGEYSQYLGARWLDNETLVFNVHGGDAPVLSVGVVNPFTGEREEFPSDYPNIRPESLGPVNSINFHFLYTSVVYHPALNLAIYPEYTDEGFFVVLWDRLTHKALARVKDLDEFLHIPKWSPSGSRFVVAVAVQTNDPGRAWIEEYYEVGQDGQVTQLTQFGDGYLHSQIGNAGWSPDGQYLAFWLATDPSECGEGQHLAIMELKTRQITNTCILGSPYYDAPSPVWSLDSKYITTINYIPDEDMFRMILVDVKSGWVAQISEAAPIGGDSSPIGWLVSP